MNQSYKKIKKKSLNDKILECVLKGAFQYENINLYKIDEYYLIIINNRKNNENIIEHDDLYNNSKIELNTIYGLIDLFNTEEDKEYIKNIEDACKNIEQDLDDYNYIRKINNNSLVIKRNYFDVRELVLHDNEDIKLLYRL